MKYRGIEIKTTVGIASPVQSWDSKDNEFLALLHLLQYFMPYLGVRNITHLDCVRAIRGSKGPVWSIAQRSSGLGCALQSSYRLDRIKPAELLHSKIELFSFKIECIPTHYGLRHLTYFRLHRIIVMQSILVLPLAIHRFCPQKACTDHMYSCCKRFLTAIHPL